MPKPFFSADEKLNVLTRIASGEDLDELAAELGLTFNQLKKYTYNHNQDFKMIEERIVDDLLSEVLPPLDRAAKALGASFKMMYHRAYINTRPVTFHEAISLANRRLISQKRPVIYYPGVLEPDKGE